MKYLLHHAVKLKNFTKYKKSFIKKEGLDKH